MNNNKVKVLVAAVLIATYSGTSYAAQMTNQQIQALVNQVVNQKTQSLQHEVGQLNAEVVGLRKQLIAAGQRPKTYRHSVNRKHSSVAANSTYPSASSSYTASVNPVRPSPTAATGNGPAAPSGYHANHPINPNYSYINVPANMVALDRAALTRIYLGGTPVFTSPYIGVHSAYDGSNLIVNQSNVNLDTRILKQGQALDDAIAEKGLPAPDSPLVQLSGDIEALANAIKVSPGNTKGDINLSDAQLDVYAQADPWVFGFLSFDWQDSFSTPYRVANTNATIDKAFVTVGNLSKSPFYGSIGQLYVPFGQYSSYMISSPLTEFLGRTKARAAVLGLFPQGHTGVFASTYVFKSDTKGTNGTTGGVNLGYRYYFHQITGDIAVGAISNIADSQGMQLNGAPSSIPFGGFGITNRTENIFKNVPAVDVHGIITYKHWNLIGEYIDTTTAFDRRAMTFNGFRVFPSRRYIGFGARPTAGQIEGVYTFHCHNRPGSLALGYNWTTNALALLLPKQRYIATINYSFWRDTMESLEFRHDVNYAFTNRATGAQSAPFGPLNKWVNMVTFQIAVFF